MKELLKHIIFDQREKDISQMIERDIDISLVNSPEVLVISGIRRCGKSVLLQQIRSQQTEQDYYMNFDDERLINFKVDDFQTLYEAFIELFGEQKTFYFDEIQNIPGWERFVRRLHDSGCKVFVTGSNANMLSRELGTHLTGRYCQIELYPFSFPEYLKYQHFDLVANWEYNLKVKAELVKKFETYFYFGGFAETFPLKDKRSWLNSLFQKILLGDVISRNDIRNESSIRLIVKKLAESIMQPLALARILGVIKSAGCSLSYNTLVDYLQYLNDAYLIFGISNFSDKLSEKESIKKRYFFDNGLLNTFIIEPESKLLENLVAIELKKRYQEGVFYYKKNVEVDFYIPSMHSAIQVSLSLSQSDTREREVRALIKMSQAYPLKKLQIITWEEEDVVEEADLHIEVLPLWKWLLI